MNTLANPHNARTRRKPKSPPFDWLKALIVFVFLASGLWVTVAPFDWRAILLLWISSGAFMAHHRRSKWINRRLQFWGMIALGAWFGLELAGGLWFMLTLFHLFILAGL